MSISPMDLDSSLDDLIRKRKSNKPNHSYPKKQQQGKKQQHQHQQQTKSRPALNVNSKAKVTKPQRTGGINSRLVNIYIHVKNKISARLNKSFFIQSTPNTSSGPLFTSKNQPAKRIADPSQIIITKAIPPSQRINKKNNIDRPSVLHGRLGKQPERVETNIYQRPSAVLPPPPPPPAPVANHNVVSNFSIRGRSSTVTNTSGLSIRGESGPTLILVTGLDPGTNDDDVKVNI